MERRRLIQAGAGIAAAAAAVPTGTAHATAALPHDGTGDATGVRGATGTPQAPDGCSGEPITTHGTASLTAAIVGMTVLNGKGYVVARGQRPPLFGEIDLTTRQLVRSVRLGRGDGGWAATTSGAFVYAGTYPYPDIYRFDPATGEVKLIGTVGPAGGFVWCLTTAPDGAVYAGTYPRGEVWEYRPDTGVLRNMGVAFPGQTYVRAIAADDRFVYAGTLATGYVIAYDRATGAKTNITPTPYGPPAALLATGGRIIGSHGRNIVDLAPDGSDPRIATVPADERLVDAMTIGPDGALYCVGRPTGTVYRREGDAFTAVATPVTGDEHRGVFTLDDRTLVGGAGSGRLWWLDLPTKRSQTLELIDVGLAGPDPVQSVTTGRRGAVHVGGHFALTTHRPASGTRKRTQLAGEAKQIMEVNGRLYAAMYPSTELLEIDPDTHRIRSLGRVQNAQQRPTDMVHSPRRDQLLITTAPGVGLLKGALTVLDRRRRTFTVHHDVITDQSLMSVALPDGHDGPDRHGRSVVYLAGDAVGGGSVPPTRQNGTVVAYDLRSRQVLWEVTPVPGNISLQHIVVQDGILYGICKRVGGVWFALDLETRTVLRTGKLPGYGELSVHRGQVFASVFGGLVYRLGPDLAEPVPVVSGLGEGWYNPPQLGWERLSWHAWGVADRDLARMRLDPDCPPPPPGRLPAPPDEAVLEALLEN
ncbi:hypothetical protein [Streptomyces sp. NPDC050504]|uniref:hypothetical protein n=1 Tax=Streptomyces sp. NPDC050504 TaxID=3365618 RepID=UPI0037B7C1E5